MNPAAEADVSANGNANTSESQASSSAKSQDARDGVDVNPAAEADVSANGNANTSESQASSSAKSQDGVDVKPEPGEADAPGGGKTKPEAEGQKPVENADGKKPLGEDETGPEEAGVDDLEKKALEEQAAELEGLRAKNTTYQAFGAGAQTITTMGSGIGSLAAMDDTQAAKLADSDAARHAAEAEEDKGEGDVVREVQNNLSEDIKSTVAFMKELNRAEEEEMKAVTSRA